MIPTLILAGIMLGFLPQRWSVVGIVVAAAAWTLLLALSRAGTPFDGTSMLGDFALAVVNGAIAAFATRKAIGLVRAVPG